MSTRRVEITLIERKRIVTRRLALNCPVCNLITELLTAQEAGAMVRIKVKSIYRWLAQGKIHGIKTPGGRHRICKGSLFHSHSTQPVPRYSQEAL